MNTQSPTTEAERLYGHLCEAYHGRDLAAVLADYDAALEAARTEGRREAVREIRFLLFTQEYGPQPLAERIAAILDEVAALNASESPPPLPTFVDVGTSEGRAELIDALVGDASESIQPPENSDGR